MSMVHEYVVVEYREGHAAEDIAEFCDRFGERGYQLTFVLESERTLIFERGRTVPR